MKLNFLLDYLYNKNSCGRPKSKISLKTLLDLLEKLGFRESEIAESIRDFLVNKNVFMKYKGELNNKCTNNL